MQVTKTSLTGVSIGSYVIVTPQYKYLSADLSAFQHATSLEDARAKASHMIDAKIYLAEIVTVEGFFGQLTRTTEVTNQDSPQV